MSQFGIFEFERRRIVLCGGNVDFCDDEKHIDDNAYVDLWGMQMHSDDPRDVRQCRENNPALSDGLPSLSANDYCDQNCMMKL